MKLSQPAANAAAMLFESIPYPRHVGRQFLNRNDAPLIII
jgi:hypothetical protein